ncbi:recombination mediator RecR [Thermorudis peleae]|uniref:recombination mediator RecR n=1 Tax=Thermorudis peleae TaxID=1382356 RepID=UPI000570E074|nr:recombination mediator RecR [Thermorudis peleae]MBX6754445.1 recombination protein RecR [Thermorudis peleae]
MRTRPTKITVEPVARLIDELAKLPGIGPKTASRLAYHILRGSREEALALAQAIMEVKERVSLCSVCFNITDVDPCAICQDPQRERSVICVVEDPLDVLALERTGEYHGLYHVLHGAISPVDGIGPDQLKIRELIARVQQERPQEVILALNPNIEGDATAMYLARQLIPLGVLVTRPASGLPAGGDLEYADEVTLGRALAGRRAL